MMKSLEDLRALRALDLVFEYRPAPMPVPGVNYITLFARNYLLGLPPRTILSLSTPTHDVISGEMPIKDMVGLTFGFVGGQVLMNGIRLEENGGLLAEILTIGLNSPME